MSFLRVMILLMAMMGVVTARETAHQRPRPRTAPETFTSPMQARTGAGASAATLLMRIDRYTPDAERQTMSDALKYGGYVAFLPALRKAPAVGYVAIGDVKTTLRWAREQPTPKGREISLVTDAPVYFVGGGRADAKPREGFELAIIRLTVDDYGFGIGTMAAAARVKPDGQGGVVVEDYAEEPIRLTYVHREIQ